MSWHLYPELAVVASPQTRCPVALHTLLSASLA